MINLLNKSFRRKAKGLLNISSKDTLRSIKPKIIDLRRIINLSNDKKLQIIGILNKILRDSQTELETMEHQIKNYKLNYDTGKHINHIQDMNFVRETLIQIENHTRVFL